MKTLISVCIALVRPDLPYFAVAASEYTNNVSSEYMAEQLLPAILYCETAAISMLTGSIETGFLTLLVV